MKNMLDIKADTNRKGIEIPFYQEFAIERRNIVTLVNKSIENFF